MEFEEIATVPSTINHKQSVTGSRKRLHFRERWRDAEYRRRFYQSLSICGSMFTIGSIFGQIGATLLDLQIITNTSLDQASAFITSGSIGVLSGTFLCGIIFGKVHADLLMFIGGILTAGTSFATPFCTNYELMNFMRFSNGFSCSILNTGSNALIISLWGMEGQQWMQLLHLCFAIGGVTSPLYTEPFLAPETKSFVNETAQNTTSDFVSNSSYSINPRETNVKYAFMTNSSYSINPRETNVKYAFMTNSSYSINPRETNVKYAFMTNSSYSINPRETNVKYAFMISGGFSCISCIPFLLFYFMNRKRVDLRQEKKEETRNQRKLPRLVMFFTLLLLCIFLMCHCSVEFTFSTYLMTFLVREYDSVSKSKGAFITAIYWAAFASGRFLNVFMTRAFSLIRLLAISLSLTLVSFTGFLIAARNGIINALIGFTVLVGLSMSGVFAAALSWTEAELLKVNGFITALLIFAPSLTGVVTPLILGHLMEAFSYMWFCYLLMGTIIMSSSMFVVLLVYSRLYLNRRFGSSSLCISEEVNFRESFLVNHRKESDTKRNHLKESV